MKKGIIFVLIFSICFFLITPVNYALSTDNKNVYNILLIGKDGISKENSRSDTMIILTIDNNHKILKLTSLARDTLVHIENKGPDKLNHAFYYGGVDLLLKTINSNFNLNIKDYAIVDFKSFVEVINILGGVDINIENREIEDLNKSIEACYGLGIDNLGNNIEYIVNSGENLLNGYQALAYCRLRKSDNCFNRDNRQRKILQSLAYKLSKVSIWKYPELISTILKYVEVNISVEKIFNLAIISRNLKNYEMEQLEFPLENFREDGRLQVTDQYVIKWDKKENLKFLHEFIYN